MQFTDLPDTTVQEGKHFRERNSVGLTLLGSPPYGSNDRTRPVKQLEIEALSIEGHVNCEPECTVPSTNTV